MADFFEREKSELIVDATHPYAVEVTKNIRSAAEEAGISYVRVLRDKMCIRDRCCTYGGDCHSLGEYAARNDTASRCV